MRLTQRWLPHMGALKAQVQVEVEVEAEVEVEVEVLAVLAVLGEGQRAEGTTRDNWYVTENLYLSQ